MNELELELQRKRNVIHATIISFYYESDIFIDNHQEFILAMEPAERVKYIIKNFTLYKTSLYDGDDEPDTYTIFCISNEIKTLVNYCVKCFPGYRISYDDDETTAVYIQKILSEEELCQRKIQEDLERLQQNIKFKQDEVLRLQLEEEKLKTQLNK